MYAIKCPTCRKDHPRTAYRMRGGGIHKQCPDCRKKEYASRASLRKKITKAKEQIDTQQKEDWIKRKSRELRVEFNRITRLNRTRIRILKANTKPTKATIRNLAHREAQQAAWALALEQMLTKVQEGEQITIGLSDYYAENICTNK